MDLNLLWFMLLGLLLTGYAVLDGFDLGVGIVHLAARRDTDRRVLMNAIGPLWDGNEVWLVTFGGALFAAFPEAYATAFSGFYLPFVALLFALIFRAVSIEFRSKRDMGWWRTSWDVAFSIASGLAAVLFGVAVGDSILGITIGADHEFAGTILDLLHPYALLTGLFVASLFAMHGTIFLYLKTEGELQQRVHHWMWRSFGIFLMFYLLTTIFTLALVPTATHNFTAHPAAWIVVVLNVLAVANIPRAIFHGRPVDAFASSCATIIALTFLFGVALYPDLIASSIDPRYSLTIYDAASSPKTLWIMAVIAMLGMPFVVTYTAVIYWTFRGKVQLGKFSY